MAALRLRAFALLWLGQSVSLIGSGLTGFALGVYVYRETGSVASFAQIQLLGFAPAALLSPFAGALTDRWDRRRLLIACDALAAVVPLLLAWAMRDGHAALWQIGLANAVLSSLSAFQWPAFSTLTAALVPPEHLGRAVGATELARAIAQIFSPVTAGIALSGGVSIDTLLVIYSVSHLFSAGLLIAIGRVQLAAPGAAHARAPATLLQDIARGWRYLTTRRDLLVLLGFITFITLSCALVEICITPRVLSFASPAALGALLWIAGVGMLLGGLLMSAWKGARRPMRLVLAVALVQGVLLIIAGASHGFVLLTVAAFLYLFSVPISMATNQAIWLRAVPTEMQGCVLGLRRSVEGAAMPLAALAAGPLVEGVLDPFLAGDGRVASLLAGLVATDPGRGIALMYIALGVITVLAAAVALAFAWRPALPSAEGPP